MNAITVIALAIGVAMDAFVISVCKGTALKKVAITQMLIIGGWLGFFHFLMPLFGGFVGAGIHDFISRIDHWVVFFVLGFLGLKMIYEACTGKEEEITDKIDPKTMLFLSFILSLDALAIGASVASKGDLFITAAQTGIVTFCLCAIGQKIGSVFGNILGRKALFLGGSIILQVGVMAVLEAYGIVAVF